MIEDESRFNVDIAGKVSEMEYLLKKVLPKNVIWKRIQTKGFEFDGYRDYNLEDDAVNIDWKATVRSNRTLLKKYVEEKDRNFFFFVDVSENSVFGSTEKIKCEFNAELAASLSHLILMNGDKIGFVLYNDDIVKIRQPELGRRQFDIFTYELINHENYGGLSNLNKVLTKTMNTIDKSTSLVFLISDFISLNKEYKKSLEVLSGLFETVAFIVRDPLDKHMPEMSKEVILEDLETHEKIIVNPSFVRNEYEINASENLKFVKELFKDLNIDFLELSTEDNFSLEIANFLKERINGGRINRK